MVFNFETRCLSALVRRPQVSGSIVLVAIGCATIVSLLLACQNPAVSGPGSPGAGNSGSGSTASAPSTPTGLFVGSATANSLTVTWNAVSTATSYQLFRAASAGGPFSDQIYSNSSTTFVDTGLQASTSYYYEVRATNASGSSALTSAVAGTTAPATTGGTLPATPTGLSVGSATASSLTVTWNAVSSATSYQLFRAASAGGPFTDQIYSNSSVGFVDSGLSVSTTYYYEVRATGTAGSSALSSAASGSTTEAPPSTPTGLSVGRSATASSLLITWNTVSGATSYQLFRAASASGPFTVQIGSVPTSYFVDTGLSASTSYSYEVRATNSGGSSPLSSEVSGSTNTTTVYASGGVGQGCAGTAGYWKNGSWVPLNDSSGYDSGQVESLAVSGSSVYAVGGGFFCGVSAMRPGYWLNGSWSSLALDGGDSSGWANTVLISGSEVYIGGQIGSTFPDESGYWLNGSWNSITLPIGDTYGYLDALAVSGSEVYAGGYVASSSTSGDLPGYWNNGSWVALPLPSGDTVGSAASLALFGSTIYAGGYVASSSTSGDIPGYWYNGSWVALPLPSGDTEGSVASLAISGSTIYAGGYIASSSTSDDIPGYWNNGSWVALPLPSGATSGSVSSLAVSGSTVYASGQAGSTPGYWQNGTWVPLALPSRETSGRVDSLVVTGP